MCAACPSVAPSRAAAPRQNPTRDFLLRVSYVEIYNEDIKDLLDPEVSTLRIREDRVRVRSRAWWVRVAATRD